MFVVIKKKVVHGLIILKVMLCLKMWYTLVYIVNLYGLYRENDENPMDLGIHSRNCFQTKPYVE
jgi:hypothetical protein